MPEKNKIIKVMHVIPAITSGGVEKRRLTIVKGLDQYRFKHKILCLGAYGVLVDALIKAGAEITNLNTKWSIFNLEALLKISKEIKVWKPDIVHCAIFEGMVLGGLAAILSGNNHLILEDTSDLYGNPRSSSAQILLRLISLASDAYVAISPPVGEYLIKEQKVNQKLVKVINNGVAEPIKPDEQDILIEKKRLGFPPNAFIIGSVGRMLNSTKRFTDIIDAICLLKKDINNIYLLLVGEGPDLSMLQQYAEQKGIKERVVFAGYRHDLGMVYSLMDLFVLASAHEGFGLVLVEAMFSSLPVIATNVGGIPGIVMDEKTGILVPPLNPEAFAKAIIKLYNFPELRAQMGIIGRQRAIDKFSEQRYVKDIKDLYCSLLNSLK